MTSSTLKQSTISVLKVCTLPLSIIWGFILGGFAGALFGVAGMGAAVGVALGLGVGVGLTAKYAVNFFESER